MKKGRQMIKCGMDAVQQTKLLIGVFSNEK